MCQNGIDLHLGTNVLEMKKQGDKIWVKATNGSEQLFDVVMYATGRARMPMIWGLRRGRRARSQG